MTDNPYDVLIIGSGPGGYVTAIRAAQLGFRTAIVERERLGGICLNWGCIPTKALLRTAEVFHLMQNAAAYGLSAENVRFDIAKVVQRSRKVADQLARGVAHLMKKHKVTVIEGEAKLLGKGRVAVAKDGKAVAEASAKHIIVATGARARELPHLKADGRQVWTYRHAMVPESFPKSLLVIGSGAIGIEFASFYRTLGAEVTVVEMLDRILPVEDEEISGLAAKAFAKQGIRLITGATVDKLDKTASEVSATIKGKDGKAETVKAETVKAERVIVAIGIVGNVEGLGLEEAGVKVDRGHIVIDEWCRTGAEGIYAIGDVAGPPWLAHKAMHEGVICIEKLAGLPGVHPLDVLNIPGCTYSYPQVASIGLTEAAARAAGYEIRVGRFPFIGNGKAIALGEPEGLTKTVFDAKTGELLGAHMIGAEVTELIQGFGIARTMEGTEEDLIRATFPHPTISETMHEGVLDAYGRALHF